jgi:hypothetical protein
LAIRGAAKRGAAQNYKDCHRQVNVSLFSGSLYSSRPDPQSHDLHAGFLSSGPRPPPPHLLRPPPPPPAPAATTTSSIPVLLQAPAALASPSQPPNRAATPPGASNRAATPPSLAGQPRQNGFLAQPNDGALPNVSCSSDEAGVALGSWIEGVSGSQGTSEHALSLLTSHPSTLRHLTSVLWRKNYLPPIDTCRSHYKPKPGKVASLADQVVPLISMVFH